MATKKTQGAKSIIEQLSRPLELSDIDFRVQSISAKGYTTILAYKDARVDMNRLDEVCGENWQNDYQLIDGQLFARIGILIDGSWIWRQDVGIESKTEKEKGRASDAFKRAGFRWGIGRELYDYPRIFLQLKPEEFEVKSFNGKQIGTATFKLNLKKWRWEWEEDVLKGYDQNGVLRFDSSKDFNPAPNTAQPTQPAPAPKQKPQMTDAQFKTALKSEDLNALKKALVSYQLTPEQIKGLSERIATLNNK